MAWSRVQKVVLFLFLSIFVAGFAAVGVAAYLLVGRKAHVPSHSVLWLKVRGPLPDLQPGGTLLEELFGGESEPSFLDLLETLRKARADKRIDAVVVELEGFSAGWGKAEELRETLVQLRQGGKKVVASLQDPRFVDYFIASAADSVVLAPTGVLFLQGLAAQALFFGGALEKVGVSMDAFQLGRYKTAPEQFTRSQMSEAQREVTNAILDDVYPRVLGAIAQSRQLAPEELAALVDGAPYGAQAAKDAKLVDALGYPDDAEQALEAAVGRKLERVEASDYRRVSAASLGLERGGKLAVIFVGGIIVAGESGGSPVGGGNAGAQTLVEALEQAQDDDSISAIVLRVDSPGGVVTASDLVWSAVAAAREEKPVVVSMADVAASGGYYIAAPANRVVAQPSTLTGSIGVFTMKPVLKGLYDKLGVSAEYVLRGKNAGLFRETQPFSEGERARFFGALKDFYYQQFLPKVAKGRGKEPAYIDSIGQGRVWTGAQAKEKGLVDELGGLERAIAVAKELANLSKDQDVKRVIFPEPKSFLESLLERPRLAVSPRELAALPATLREVVRWADVLIQVRPGELMALPPFLITLQ